jgi:RHS repeat-associated protein
LPSVYHSTQYTYTHLGQLWQDSYEEWYLYDASGQRVLRRSQTGTGNSNTRYTITAFGLEDHIYNGAGTNLNNKYYYSLAGRLIGVNNGSTNYLLTDALGTVISSITNTSSASVQGNQLYGPYGFSLYSKGTMGTTKGYTGQYNDSLTQLDYYNARYYDPLVGVFVSADTLQGNMQGMDPYTYVGANPETFNDPTGHEPPPNLFQTILQILVKAVVMTAPASPALFGVGFLIVTSVAIMQAPDNEHHGYPPNSPQPEPAPTPNPTPSTDTNGARCRTARCYDLTKDEGISIYSFIRRSNGAYFRRVSTAHTIAQHVDISDAQLLQRSANQTAPATKFFSLDAAEWAVQYALDHDPTKSAQLSRLVGNHDNAGQTINFDVDTGTNIGYGYQGGNPTKIDLTWVHVIIMINYDGTPFVLTAYPELPQPTNPVSPIITPQSGEYSLPPTRDGLHPM